MHVLTGGWRLNWIPFCYIQSHHSCYLCYFCHSVFAKK